MREEELLRLGEVIGFERERKVEVIAGDVNGFGLGWRNSMIGMMAMFSALAKILQRGASC